MAKEKLTLDYEVIDKASRELSRISDQLKEADRATDELGETSGKTAGKTDALGGSLKKGSGAMAMLGPAAIGAAAGVAVLTVGITKAIDAVQASIDAYEEQYGVNESLKDSLRRNADEAANLEAQYGALQGTITDLSHTTNFSDEQISQATSTLMDLTGQSLDAAEAERQLDTILGLAAKRRIDATAAAEKYAKAKKGEVEPLKELIPLTKKEAEELNKLEDETKKIEIATRLLEERYGGAAQSLNQGFFAATKNLDDALGDTSQAIGEVIVESGAFEPVVDVLTGLLWDLQEVIGANAEGIQHWLIDSMDKGLEYAVTFLEWMRQATPVLTGVATYLRITANVQQVLFNGVQILGRGIKIVYLGLMSQALGALEKFLEAGEFLASYLDDDFAASIRSAREAVDGFQGDVDDEAVATLNNLKGDFEDISTDLDDIAQALLDAPEIDAAAKDAISGLIDRLEGARDNLDKAREAVGSTGLEGGGHGGGGTSDDAVGQSSKVKDLGDELAILEKLTDEADEQVQAEMRRDEVAGLRLQKLYASDELTKAALDRQIALVELEGKELTDQERRLELAKIEHDYRAAAQKSEADARAERQKALEEELAAWDRMGDRIEHAFAFGGTKAAGWGKLIGGLEGATTQFAELEAKGKSAEEALTASLGTAGSAAAAFAESQGASYELLAGLKATFATAEGFLQASMGNIPGSIAAFTAAAIYGGMAAAGAPSSGKSSGKAAQSAPESSAPSRQDTFETLKKANLEAMREARKESRSATYIFDQSGSTFLERDPASVRKARRTLDGADRLRLGA